MDGKGRRSRVVYRTVHHRKQDSDLRLRPAFNVQLHRIHMVLGHLVEGPGRTRIVRRREDHLQRTAVEDTVRVGGRQVRRAFRELCRPSHSSRVIRGREVAEMRYQTCHCNLRHRLVAMDGLGAPTMVVLGRKTWLRRGRGVRVLQSRRITRRMEDQFCIMVSCAFLFRSPIDLEKRLLTSGLSESDVYVPSADSRGIGLRKG